MTSFSTMAPALRATAKVAVVFIAGALWLGLPVSTQVLAATFVLSNVPVIVATSVFIVLSWWLVELRIVCSVIFSVAYWFLARIGLPQSYTLVAVALLFWNDPQLAEVFSRLNVLSPGTDLASSLALVLSGFAWVLFLDRVQAVLGLPATASNVMTGQKGRARERIWLVGAVIIVMLVIASMPPSYDAFFVVFVSAGLFLIATSAVMVLRHARMMHAGATAAAPTATDKLCAPPWAVHLSDVHLTRAGETAVEGGTGGNDNLQRQVSMFLERPPAFLFITGDLTDHGSREEWAEASRILAPLATAGCRVLIAPGNHDLSIAYDNGAQFYSAVAAQVYDQDGMLRYMNGVKFWSYLQTLSRLAGNVTTGSGTSLSEYLQMFAWEEELYRSVSRRAQDEERLIAEFVQKLKGLKLGKTLALDEKFFAHLRRLCADHHTGFSSESFNAFVGHYWVHEWSALFPLCTFDRSTNTEIFILNSVVLDPKLAPSATGDLGDCQTRQLSHALQRSNARHIVVLVHHAPFRWTDERAPTWNREEILRWATLAMSKTCSEGLLRALAATISRGKTITLFCGHRHGGKSREARIGTWSGGTIAEAAATVDSGSLIAVASPKSARDTRLKLQILSQACAAENTGKRAKPE
jgi:hypothetical protein